MAESVSGLDTLCIHMAENVGGRGFRVCVGPEMVTETRNEFG